MYCMGDNVACSNATERRPVPSCITMRARGVGFGVGALDASVGVGGAGDSMQNVGPIKLLLENFPGGHAMQAPLPADAWNVPALHAVHGLPFELYRPATHTIGHLRDGLPAWL